MDHRKELEQFVGWGKGAIIMATAVAVDWAIGEIDRLTAENARLAAELAAERADRDAAWFDRGDTDNQDGEGQS